MPQTKVPFPKTTKKKTKINVLNECFRYVDVVYMNPLAPPYTGWLPSLPTRSPKKIVTCADLGGDEKYEMARWRLDMPYVALIQVRQVCGCIGEQCGYGLHGCCQLIGGGVIPTETYTIPVIFWNSYHADHSMPNCTRKYINCVNAKYGLQLIYEKERYVCTVLDEPYALKENEACVDLRYYIFIP